MVRYWWNWIDLSIEPTQEGSTMDDNTQDGPELEQDADVQFVIENKQGDGPGNLDELPESDFEGYASDDVEQEQEDDN